MSEGMHAAAESAGWAIVQASLVGTAAAAAAVGICRLVPALPARLRCVLWWLVCAKLVWGLAPIALVSLPILPATIGSASERTTTPAARSMMPHAVIPVETSAATSLASPASRDVAPAQTTHSRVARWTPTVLVGLWLLGVAAAGAHTWLRHARTRAIVRQASQASPAIDGLLRASMSRLALACPVRVVVSDEARTPFVSGVRHPVIVLPGELLTTFPPEHLRMTLVHELLHIKRRDLWLGCLPALASHLFFFHPAARLAVREYLVAREMACDGDVVGELDAAPADYGRMLIAFGVGPRPLVTGAGASTTFHTLKRRLDMPSFPRLAPRPLHWWLLAIVALAIVLPLKLVAQTALPAPPPLPPAPPTPAVPFVAPAPPEPSLVPLPPLPPPAPEVPPAAPSAPESPMAPVPPDPPIPPDPAAAPSREHAWILVLNGEIVSTSGSWSDVRAAREAAGGGSLLWVRRRGETFLIRDPDLVKQAQTVLEQSLELGLKQSQLGAKQGELGRQQGDLGQRQGRLGEQQTALASRMASLQARLADIARQLEEQADRLGVSPRASEADVNANRESVRQKEREVRAQMQELSRQMEALGREQSELGREQQELGRLQREAGREQRALGREQRAAAARASDEIDNLVEQAIASGAAQRAR